MLCSDSLGAGATLWKKGLRLLRKGHCRFVDLMLEVIDGAAVIDAGR